MGSNRIRYYKVFVFFCQLVTLKLMLCWFLMGASLDTCTRVTNVCPMISGRLKQRQNASNKGSTCMAMEFCWHVMWICFLELSLFAAPENTKRPKLWSQPQLKLRHPHQLAVTWRHLLPSLKNLYQKKVLVSNILYWGKNVCK